MAYLRSEKTERVKGANPYRVRIMNTEGVALHTGYRVTLDGAYSFAYRKLDDLWGKGADLPITVHIERRIGETRDYRHEFKHTYKQGELPVH